MKNSQIVICSKCKGIGKVIREYYKSPKQPSIADCEICQGTGRVVRVITVDYFPLDTMKNSSLEIICVTDEYEKQ